MTRTIEGIGPIQKFELPSDAGIHVVKGDNGVGKTTVLECVDATVDEKTRKRLEKTDGRSTTGKIAFDGFQIAVGGTRRKSGALACKILPSDCDPSKLVDPQIEDKARADVARLKIVLRMLGITFSEDQWRAALGVDSDTALPAAINPEDPVATAQALRDAIYEKARPLEEEALKLQGAADGLLAEIVGVDTSEVDEDKLREAATEASTALALAEQQEKNADDAVDQRERDREALRKLEGAMPNVAELVEQEAVATDAAHQAEEEVDKLKEQIDALTKQRNELVPKATALVDQADAATKAREDAQRQETRICELSESINAPIQRPGEDAVETLRIAKAKVDQAVQDAKHGREARETKQRAEQKANDSKEKAAKAKRLRDYAGKTDSALGEALKAAGVEGMTVQDGRLCVPTDRSPTEAFADLSEGERWGIVLAMLPNDIVCTIGHSGWTAMNDHRKKAAAEAFAEKNICAYAEEVETDGELRVEKYEPKQEPADAGRDDA